MAAKTSTFFLTERLSLAAGTNSSAEDTIDLGAYVDVADRQGVLIHEVDFIFQGKDTANGAVTSYTQTMTLDGATVVQLSDLNRGALVFADDRALVASGELVYDSANQLSHASDLYPDNFGPSSAAGGRIVINDQMYVRATCFGTIVAGLAQEVTVRIKCSVITLSQKDFMAIALQSTAADN